METKCLLVQHIGALVHGHHSIYKSRIQPFQKSNQPSKSNQIQSI